MAADPRGMFRKSSEPDVVSGLTHAEEEIRQEAFREICARGEKRGWEAFGLLTRDPFLAGLFRSLKNPFDAVGIAVAPDTFERVRTHWPAAVEQEDAGRRELAIHFRNQRLDVMTIDPGAWPPGEKYPAGREGVCEVEFRVKDLDAFVHRLGELTGELKGRLILLPVDPALPRGPRPCRSLLAHTRGPRGAQTILVQIVSY